MKRELVNEEIKTTGASAETEIAAPGFTPGEWLLKGPFLEDEHTCGYAHCVAHPKRMTGFELYADPNGERLWIASIHGEHVDIPREQAEANARLFYAAPALYDAITRLLDAMEMQEGREKEELLIRQQEAWSIWVNAKLHARAALALVDNPQSNKE